MSQLPAYKELIPALLDCLHEGVIVVARGGELLAVNTVAQKLLGQLRAYGETLTASAFDCVRADHTPMPYEESPAARTLASGEPVMDELIGVRLRLNGTVLWFRLNTKPLFKDGETECSALLCTFLDVTEQHRSEADLTRRAFYDGLTGLPNRALFLDRCERALSQARRQLQQVAIGFLDLDRFKRLNDTRGHIAGDTVLQHVAQRLLYGLRDGDTVARLGGDEFALLLPWVSGPEDLARIGERVIQVLREPLHGLEGGSGIRASLGLSVFPRDGNAIETLLDRADQAMYEVKELGGDGYAIAGQSEFSDLALRSARAESVPKAARPRGSSRRKQGS